MEEDSLQAKQMFLRTNILDKNYSAEDFMGFLSSKKGEDGLDLNNWTMDELLEAVNEFIIAQGGNPQDLAQANTQQNNNPNAENAQANPGSDEYNQHQNQQENMNQGNQNEQNANPELDEQQPEEFVPCKKTEVSTISTRSNVNCTVAFPEKVQGTFFSKSYVTYLIQTDPFGYKVRKRYSDFDWLKTHLTNHYVNCVIPPLSKKVMGSRFDEYLISKRTRSMQKFMNGLLIHPVIRHSQVLQDFLSTETEENWKKKQNIYSKAQYPSSIKDIKNMDGFVNVSVTKKKEIFFANIKDSSILFEEILQKITKAHKSLLETMKVASNKMKEISLLWKDMYDKSQKYFENGNTCETYKVFSQFMDEWSTIQNRQIILINNEVREYARYVKNEYHNLQNLAVKVESNRAIYIKARDKLRATKEQLYRGKDCSLWQLDKKDLDNKMLLLQDPELAYSKMLPKDTKRVNELKNYYGMFLNSIISEYERIRNLNGSRHRKNIYHFLTNFSGILTDFQLSFTDTMALFQDAGDEEQQQVNVIPEKMEESPEGNTEGNEEEKPEEGKKDNDLENE